MGLVLVSMAVADTGVGQTTVHGEHERPEMRNFAAGRDPGK